MMLLVSSLQWAEIAKRVGHMREDAPYCKDILGSVVVELE